MQLFNAVAEKIIGVASRDFAGICIGRGFVVEGVGRVFLGIIGMGDRKGLAIDVRECLGCIP